MRRKFPLKFLLVLVLAVLVLGAGASYLQPIPSVRPVLVAKEKQSGEAVDLPWPAYGQAAIGASGHGVLQTYGEQKAVPIASIAKVITALAVLEKKPLPLDDEGQPITIGTTDVQLFEDYFAIGGSVVKVQNGEQISQYEALQGMLLPSGNNMADSLARWAFGSVEAYTEYANKMVSSMGLSKTKVADASGFSPNTVSSPEDLVRLGERVMATPVLAEIVGQKTAIIPVAGEISNVNWLLGQDGVVGIKTGNTDEAGGCFLFASNQTVDGEQVTVIGAVLNAPTRNQAIEDSRVLAVTAASKFERRVLIADGEVIGQYTAPWGASAQAVAKEDLSAVVWKASSATTDIKLKPVSGGSEAGHAEVGAVTVTLGSKKASQVAVLSKPLAGPSWTWRIFH